MRTIDVSLKLLLVLLCVLMGFAAPAAFADGPLRAQLTVRDSYLADTGVLVRVEIVNSKGEIERGIWDATAMLSTDNPGISLSTDQVVLYNGLGSALVTFTGAGDFTLTANVNGMEAGRELIDLQAQSITEVSGQLTGDATSWSGIIHVTGDLTVPASHVLTVEPGTLVLIDGVSSGREGTDIDVKGAIESLGTFAEPVTFTAFDPDTEWGRINLKDSAPCVFRYSNITLAGRSPGEGHTGAGLILCPRNTRILFEYCSITDHTGKTMYARDSDLTFTRCHIARSVMGPEIQSTSLLFEDSYITEMFGTDDNDAIYLHGQRAGQDIELRRSVVADTDDDGIDTLGSSILIEDFIIRDVYDKGLSVNGGGPVMLDNVLIVDCAIGVSAKDGSTSGNPHVYINNCTIISTDTGESPSDIGIHAYFKYASSGVIEYFVTNSIILAEDAIKSDFEEPDPLIRIDYSNISEPWAGSGNVNTDPCFADADNGDYHPKSQAGRWNPITQTWLADEATSPCIDAGDPMAPVGLEAFGNGGIVNMGAYGGTTQASKSYFGGPPCETIVTGDINGDCEVNFKDFALLSLHWAEDNAL